MSALLAGAVVFIVTLGAGLLGLAMKSRLAEEHKSGESRGVVGQIAGLVTLLLALVLGTLIGVSYSYFATQKTELEGFSAQILRLDQALKQYGPETQPAREKLKEAIVKGYDAFWGGGEPDPAALTVAGPLASAQATMDYLATLQPKTDAQKTALSTANTYTGMIEQSRLLMALQISSPPVSWVLIAILIFWTAALFFGVGLYAESNAVVLSALTFGALSVAFAVFLILGMGQPYSGAVKINPAALREAIDYLGK
jgi:hypothetical protein